MSKHQKRRRRPVKGLPTPAAQRLRSKARHAAIRERVKKQTDTEVLAACETLLQHGYADYITPILVEQLFTPDQRETMRKRLLAEPRT